jgi:glycosyltransferase involved in cell wall biosynthesis
MSSPTISAAVRVYNAERYIGETLTAILSQTRPPEEIVVIDDGSTDETPAELARFRGEVRVVRQENSGYAGSFNRGAVEAKCDYIANCDADDVWEPEKLERQVDALRAHPQIDFAFSGARFFGLTEGPRAPYPGEGLLEAGDFAKRLYRQNFVCTSSTVIRRSLCLKVGTFRDRAAPCEDYDFWLRTLMAGAVSFYDPAVLVAYRTHAQQVSSDLLRMHKSEYLVHDWCALVAKDRSLVGRVLAKDLSNIGRVLADEDSVQQARDAFVSSLKHRPSARVLAWVLVLSTPDRLRRPLAGGLVSIKRSLISPALR